MRTLFTVEVKVLHNHCNHEELWWLIVLCYLIEQTIEKVWDIKSTMHMCFLGNSLLITVEKRIIGAKLSLDSKVLHDEKLCEYEFFISLY